jgi:microcystin-dependent protein
MPKTHTSPAGTKTVIPDYPEAADGPKAFSDFADSLDHSFVPVGAVVPFAGITAPTGWLICDGNTFSSDDYPKLAAVLAGRFGSAGKLVNLPDLKGRTVFGKSGAANDPFNNVADKGGSLKISASSIPSHEHQVPDHNHTITGAPKTGVADTAHSHTVTVTGQTNLAGAHDHGGVVVSTTDSSNNSTGGSATRLSAATKGTTATETSHQHGISVTAVVADGGQAHIHDSNIHLATISGGATKTAASAGGTDNHLPPYIVLNYIIRAA